MPTVGTTGKVSSQIEWFGLNTVNQMGVLVTMPEAGKVTHVGVWIAGRGVNARARTVLWASSGSVLRQSAQFTAASQALGPGNTTLYERALTSPYDAGNGQQLYVGFWRHPSDPVQNGFGGGGSHLHHTTSSTSGAATLGGSSHGTNAGGFYLVYETGHEVYVRRNGVWVQASAIRVRRSGAWQDVGNVRVRRNNAWQDI